MKSTKTNNIGKTIKKTNPNFLLKISAIEEKMFILFFLLGKNSPQKRHFFAEAFILSAQKGHSISSSIQFPQKRHFFAFKFISALQNGQFFLSALELSIVTPYV